MRSFNNTKLIEHSQIDVSLYYHTSELVAVYELARVTYIYIALSSDKNDK